MGRHCETRDPFDQAGWLLVWLGLCLVFVGMTIALLLVEDCGSVLFPVEQQTYLCGMTLYDRKASALTWVIPGAILNFLGIYLLIEQPDPWRSVH